MSDAANWRSNRTSTSANTAHGNRRNNQPGHAHKGSSSGRSTAPISTAEARRAREQRFNSKENIADSLANRFEHLSLVSRSVGESGLRDRSTQQALFEHLNERIRRFRNTDSSHRTGQSTEFDPILASFRKLREGIVSSAAYDTFTIQVYEQSVDLCLEAGNYAELLKSLTHFVTIVYPEAVASESDIKTPLREYSSLLLLYILCYIPANKKPQGDDTKACFDTREFMTLQGSKKRGLNQLSHAGKKMAHHIVAYVRRRTFQILSKAYFTYPIALLRQYLVCDMGCDSDKEMEKVLIELLGAGYASRVINGVIQLRVAKKRA
ncbi:hypothetical protein HDU81_005153 [Chytriomyces hyalinus]|nr:hypothetical protein HDU81_005153 [Chytriomyces hyalinus]